MRLWSLHPGYLDPKGLVALWREALLARKVLLGQTVGYRAHPQLLRFRACADPGLAIRVYLEGVWLESDRRGYRFDRRKIGATGPCSRIPVHKGQLDFEWEHLSHKLWHRNPEAARALETVGRRRLHPLFFLVSGGMEEWERTGAG